MYFSILSPTAITSEYLQSIAVNIKTVANLPNKAAWWIVRGASAAKERCKRVQVGHSFF